MTNIIPLHSVHVTDVHGSELFGLFKAPSVFAHAIKWGRTPLHWAAANGHTDGVAALLQAKASPSEVPSVHVQQK